MKHLLVVITSITLLFACQKNEIDSPTKKNQSIDSVKYDILFQINSPIDNTMIGFWQIDSARQHTTNLKNTYYEDSVMVKIGDTIKARIADHDNRGGDLIAIRLLNLTTKKDTIYIAKDSTWVILNWVIK
jgi:hypothetical protein